MTRSYGDFALLDTDNEYTVDYCTRKICTYLMFVKLLLYILCNNITK